MSEGSLLPDTSNNKPPMRVLRDWLDVGLLAFTCATSIAFVPALLILATPVILAQARRNKQLTLPIPSNIIIKSLGWDYFHLSPG